MRNLHSGKRNSKLIIVADDLKRSSEILADKEKYFLAKMS